MLKRIYSHLPDRLRPLVEGLYYTLNYTDDELWSTISDIIDKYSPVIVDGGAHEGETTSKCLELFNSPYIYAFEPNPNKTKILQNRYENNSDINIINKALAEHEGTIKMNILSESDMSSIYQPKKEYLTMMGKNISTESSVEVEKVTLDKEINRNIDILKLDLQGYEYNALQGAKEHLQITPIVTSEVMFKQAYNQQPLFCDINTFMNDHGFSLFDLFNLKYNPNGILRHAQALYINEDALFK